MTHHAQVVHTVTDHDTAIALGSGDVPVLATPRLLAWCEEATCAALSLAPEHTSVGTHIDLDHRAASAIGTTVTTTATGIAEDGRLIAFEVTAHDAAGQLLARGTVQRVVVERARFMAGIGRVGD